MDDLATVRMVAEPAKSPNSKLSGSSFDALYMRRGEVRIPASDLSTTHVRIEVPIDYEEVQCADDRAVESAGWLVCCVSGRTARPHPQALPAARAALG